MIKINKQTNKKQTNKTKQNKTKHQKKNQRNGLVLQYLD
jgi:hypothetical protein